MKTSIYVLIDPRTNEVRYVGKTVNPKRRLWSHLKDKCDCYRTRWIEQLNQLGFKPVMKIIESFDDPEDLAWKEREIFWISHFRAKAGSRLTNLDSGGVSGKIASPETRAKISSFWRGRPKSREHVEKVANAHRGRKRPAEALANMSKPRVNWSLESRLAFGLRRKGKRLTPETRLKMSIAGKGKKKSPEWRRKIGDAHIGMKRRPETRAKISAARKIFLSKNKTKSCLN